MKKWLIVIFFVMMISPFVSAEMIINQQPNEIYNLGDSVLIPITIKTITGVAGTFNMDLLCGSKQVNFYKNGVNLVAGEEERMDASLVLTKDILGENVGKCKIKAILGGEYILTNEFRISNILILQPNTEQKEYTPGESALILGNAIKENGHEVNGFIDMEILLDNSSNNILQPGTINNGMYSMNVSFPSNMRAGNYLVKLTAYEMTADGTKTNKGFINYNIIIKQVPTYLEIVFENDEVEPGTNMNVKAILHDQTGEKMSSNVILTIKKGETDIQTQVEKITDEYLEFPIVYNEPPSNWTVFALSNQLTAELPFIVIEKKEIKVDITNETVKFINTGNVPYNDTVTVKIGEESIEIPIFLKVDGSQEYQLKAPDGEYEVEVLSEGESKLKQNVLLTGRVIGIRDTSTSSLKEFFTKPLVWIFIGLILLAIIFIFIRRAYKRNPYGKLFGNSFKKKVKQHNVEKANVPWENRAMPVSKNSKLETKNRANLSISIKGNKQEVSIVNIKTKNLGELQGKKANIEEQLQKIISIAENKKAFVYENQDNLFFILTPSKTRTLNNEATALEIAQNAKEILSSYNRVAKYKTDFGIAIEYGSIVEKTENNILEFMTLGTLMTVIKRIASASQGEVLLGEKIKDKLTNVRTEKQDTGKAVFYKIKDMKYHDEEHSRFIKSFLKKAEENKEDFKVI